MPNLNRGLASVNAAFDEGRFHTQRFIKVNTTQPPTSSFSDWGATVGQPTAHARVGTPLVFVPLTGAGNNAIYFPPIPSGSKRYLASGTFRSDGTAATSIIIGDLLGYYPLLDGDSIATQTLDNTLTLPRYADGVGVIASLVGNVSPTANTGAAMVTYIDSNDVTCVTSFRIINTGTQGSILNCLSSTAGTTAGLGMPSAPNSAGKGVKRVIDITYTTSPGGIQAIYLWKPLATVVFNGDTLLSREKDFFIHNGMAAPIILDGAYLNFFAQGTNANGQRYYGDLTFIWT